LDLNAPNKWSFLNGLSHFYLSFILTFKDPFILTAEGFYRAQDENDDCVIDVADENEIYILDEITPAIE
jgi:hypothetical protein